MKEPATMVERNGSPNSRNGCFWSDLRYRAASELGSVALKDLDVKGPGIVWVSECYAQAGRLLSSANSMCCISLSESQKFESGCGVASSV